MREAREHWAIFFLHAAASLGACPVLARARGRDVAWRPYRRQSNRESARRTRAKRSEEVGALRSENEGLLGANAALSQRVDELSAANRMLVSTIAPLGEQQRWCPRLCRFFPWAFPCM